MSASTVQKDDDEELDSGRQTVPKPSASLKVESDPQELLNEAEDPFQLHSMNLEEGSDDSSVTVVLNRYLRENESPTASTPIALQRASLKQESDAVAPFRNSLPDASMIPEEESWMQQFQDVISADDFPSNYIQLLQTQERQQRFVAPSTPSEIEVYFKLWTSPGTVLWRKAVKHFSLNREEFPNWEDEICDKVISRMEENGSMVRFLVCRDKDAATASKSTQSGNWCDAKKQEILVRTKQRFFDDRKPQSNKSRKGGIKHISHNQKQHRQQPSNQTGAQQNRKTDNDPSLTVGVPEWLANCRSTIEQNPGAASASLEELLKAKSDVDAMQQRFRVARTPPESLPPTQDVVDRLLKDHYGRFGTYTGVVLQSTGMPHGRGKMRYQNDGRTYDGEWHTGSWHGHGFATFPTGDSYEGQHWFHKRHGRGIYRWKNGTVYEGGFKGGMRHGHGICTRPNDGRYEGEFVDGQREGTGVYTSFDGRTHYNGSWKNGHYDGRGTLISDSRTYSGEWRNGMSHERGLAVPTDQ